MGNVNNNGKNNKEKVEMFLFTIVAILAVITAICINFFIDQKNKEKELPYTELITLISDKEIEKIVMTTGSTTVDVILKGEEEEKERTKHTMVPSIQPFVELVQEKIDNEETDLELVQEPVNAFLKFV